MEKKKRGRRKCRKGRMWICLHHMPRSLFLFAGAQPPNQPSHLLRSALPAQSRAQEAYSLRHIDRVSGEAATGTWITWIMSHRLQGRGDNERTILIGLSPGPASSSLSHSGAITPSPFRILCRHTDLPLPRRMERCSCGCDYVDEVVQCNFGTRFGMKLCLCVSSQHKKFLWP